MTPGGDRPLVSVLGGGQLGRMLGLAGGALGCSFRFLDPSPDASAGGMGPLLVAALDDLDAVTRLADGAAVVTYEWEGVPAASARHAATLAPVRPGARVLETAQDRLAEKQAFERLGIATPKFLRVESRATLDVAAERLGLPIVVKRRHGGYDGKGQQVVRSAAQLDGAWHALGDAPLIAEELVDFDRELSVIAVRGLDGATACYPLVENSHADGILRISRAPAPRLGDTMRAEGEALARALLDEFDHVGVLTVELFERDGALLANELAPRVHNSGHWTIEGAATSQFENHLRAILGLPLGSTAARGVAAMVNCIGAMPEPAALAGLTGAFLHDYEKMPRAGRKLGHVTLVADDADHLERDVARVRALVES